MEILFIFISIVAFFIIALYVWNSIQQKKGNIENIESVSQDPVDGSCCGQHATCEKDSLMNTFVEEVEYFDDEELDEYQDIDEDSYPEHAVEQFREILYSMYDSDKPKWIRSLQKRGIAIPNQIKDEILLIINDLRTEKVH